jgi:hypothetical protein
MVSQRSTVVLVVGSLLFLVDRSSASLKLSVRPQNRYTRAHGGGSDSVNETLVTPALMYVGEPPLDSNVTYGACEGRCSRHEHCQTGLFCIQRFPGDEIISTCLPPLSSKPNNNSTVVTNTLRLLNYCAKVPENELVTLTEGNTTEVTITTACSGGCIRDRDCRGDHLKCSQPTDTTISGCSGFKNPLVNYCYFDNSTSITTSNSTDGDDSIVNVADSPPVNSDDGPALQYVGEPPSPSLLLECQGDCDSDWQCDFGLNCFKRSDDSPIPGCEGVGGKGDIYSVDYCYTPPTGTLVIVHNVTTNSTKAGKCEGDCATDNDCASDLKCFQRQNYEAVPGCDGLGAYSTNYCFNPDDEDFNSTGTLAPSKAPLAAPISKTSVPPVLIPTTFPTQKSNVIAPSPTIPVVLSTATPSVTPSIHPDQTPSRFPSNSPSTLPSNIPLAISSTAPSSLLSSFRPSETPSVGNDTISSNPSENPTVGLSAIPSEVPTFVLTESSNPSENPTVGLSAKPSEVPTFVLSEEPSGNPIVIASSVPSVAPSFDGDSTDRDLPTLLPTRKDGSVVNPPVGPSSTTALPSTSPSSDPSSLLSSFRPSETPSVSIDTISSNPSENPTVGLSAKPSEVPTFFLSEEPSGNPIVIASSVPSVAPSFDGDSTADRDLPTLLPTRKDGSVVNPPMGPSSATALPSISPSSDPLALPSLYPSLVPSSTPSLSGPSAQPSDVPTVTKSNTPSSTPTLNPSALKALSISPSSGPSEIPTVHPSSAPSESPIAGGLLPDDNCPDFVLLGRARAIYQRLLNSFHYNKSEIVYSNDTSTSGVSLLRSYQQAAFEWLVHNDEQVTCPNATKLVQRYALAAFWFACGGDNWSIAKEQSNSFLSKAVGECEWNGVSCDDNDNVVGFHLDENNITGTLPTELASLRFLRELNMDTNHLSGPIPSWIVQWKKLEVLDLDHNHFTGSIPSSLYSISTLRVLDLDSNALTGTLSESGIENWIDSLYFLQLDFNEFVGTIPSVLGKVSNLQYLSMFGNNFTSTLISSIEDLCDGTITIYANCNLCQNSTCCTACLDV